MEAGRQLTHYILAEKIGAGGMGEVWRARDTRLEREVAIKILPPALLEDAERLARFEREAKALAALNHPHIAQIFGVDQVDDVCFLVLELVPGETLADRIGSGPLPVEEALGLCRQVAEGLEAAHDAGIVHRDLKPANVRVTPDGVVKILDFGLAKAIGRDIETGETVILDSDSLSLTQDGRVLGTPTYMSPEQARGKRTDRRTDIWSFGCVLFELLAGQRAFSGETVTDVLGAIVHKEPEWGLLPERTPPRVQQLLRRCLHKDPHHRLRDIGDARVELEEILADPTASLAVAPVEAAPPRRLRAVLVLVAVAALSALAGWHAMRATLPEPRVRRFRIPVESLVRSTALPARIAPDGSALLYAASGRLWIRDLSELDARELAGTEDARHACWSPDGESLVFEQGGRLLRMSASGGPPAIVTALPGTLSPMGSLAWLSDGTIVFSSGEEGDPVWEVPAGGGDPRERLVVSAERGEKDFHQVAALPDAAGVLLVVHRLGTPRADTLAVLPAGAAEPRVLMTLPDGDFLYTPCHSPSGHVLYERIGANPGLWALPFSLDELAATGAPSIVAPAGRMPTVADDGTLAYADWGRPTGSQVVQLGRDGTVVREVGEPFNEAFNLRLSPDGQRICISAESEDDVALWALDVASGSRTRLWLEPSGFVYAEDWLPSSDEVVVGRASDADPQSTWRLAADGSGAMEKVADDLFPVAVTHDGDAVLLEPESGESFFLAPLDGSSEPVPFLVDPDETGRVSLSPDARFIAYHDHGSDLDEIYVTRFPSAQGHWLLHDAEATSPRWVGDEVFFVSGSNLMVAPVDTESGLHIGPATALFDTTRTNVGIRRGYGVSADGQSIYAIRTLADPGASTDGLVLVENWAATLEAGR